MKKAAISAILVLGTLFSIPTSAFAASRVSPAFISDTGAELTIAPDKTYQFKITSNAKPVITVGNSSVIRIISGKSSGHSYYVTIRAVGKSGQAAGVYINGIRSTVCTVDSSSSQIPNPLVSYNTVEEARKAIGFSFAVPTRLPANYQTKDIIVIGSNLAEIFYRNGKKNILYRTAKGNSDISGDYTVYKEVKTAEIGNTKVTVKGNGSLINLALWTKGGISYSLNFDEACDLKSVASIMESIE